ncbi:MAG: hypothetical protein JNJ46_16870 [Myxococcales bacterium]|nr:hypothetical protein [Myxococcales bacterium]
MAKTELHCRICWNTASWWRPTGSAREASKTYYAAHGFGHEEWLFDMTRLVDGFRYGALQPIHKLISTYEGRQIPVIYLYTRRPGANPVWIGEIRNTQVPQAEERRQVFEHFKEAGWLAEMQQELMHANIPSASENLFTPNDTFNVRFQPQDVALYPESVPVPRAHKIHRQHRYHPLLVDAEGPPPQVTVETPREVSPSSSQRLRSTELRYHPPRDGHVVDPVHDRIQKLLFETLRHTHGEAARYESNRVDLSLHLQNRTVLFEIKTERSAKQCIRLALGQLLEYAHYQRVYPRPELVVVGNCPAVSEDEEYLRLLRERYGIPVVYRFFNWETHNLDSPLA